MMEVLSPAGSPEAVVAAVQSGADAIYLGLGGFNARRGAKNFSEEEFEETVRYCRERGCRVYVTLNTLANDRELEEVARLGRFVHQTGADAVLVQDLGVARVLREVCPELTLHASTQMSVHNLAGCYAAAELGMKRVVLARELNAEQIRFIAGHSPVEVEVFVHGALCFCHSGQCYMSALIGRRSGNRGMCAQPCRLDYHMGRRMDGYPLSLKDNCLLDHIRQLEEAGVACVKIEGRMKRPEYTAIVTEIYAKAVHEHLAPTDKDREKLRLAFSREGFTDGYYTGSKTDMHGVRSEADKEVNRLFAETRRAYANGERRRVPIDLYAVVREGEPVRLLARDDEEHKVSVFGPVPEPARGAGLSEKSVGDQLYKTGGTPYHCRSVNCSVTEGLFLPASALNDLRRQALEQLSQARREAPVCRFGTMPAQPADSCGKTPPVLNVQVLSAGQLTPELAALRPNTVYVPLELLAQAPSELAAFTESTVSAVLPRIITDTETEQVLQLLAQVRDMGVTQVLAGNLGHVALARRAGFAVRGDFGLNVFNSHTLAVLGQAGLLSATASFELRMAQVRDLAKSLDTELIVYGRLPMMLTENCVMKSSTGACSCGNAPQLRDRRGAAFPVVKAYGCRNLILNSEKLFLADRFADWSGLGLWAGRLSFTTENARECVLVASRYLGQGEYAPSGRTTGLYYRGVE